ncbi:hypothetical protein K1719_016495 [Acacia pycnantha]|nr:hypothetical protein K1719_016495 [Acacia pycnantha]
MAPKDPKQAAAAGSSGGFFSSIASSLSNFDSAMTKSVNGYEGLEVINPEGGTEDAVEEAKKGRWKQEDPSVKAFHFSFMTVPTQYEIWHGSKCILFIYHGDSFKLEALYPDVYRNVHEYGNRYCKGGLFGQYQGASNHEELHNLIKATVMIQRL